VKREEKAELIKELNSTFNNSGVVVVTKQVGLTVEESTDLRIKMRKVGAKYQVAKNRIVKLALKETKYENISELFSGPTAIAVSEDPVSAPKTVFEFTKANDKFSILGGGIDGKVLSVAEVEQLASLPSLDELRAKLVGLIKSPSQKIASVAIAPANKLANIFYAKANQ
jgi:large subunit ribosomal protein L10